MTNASKVFKSTWIHFSTRIIPWISCEPPKMLILPKSSWAHCIFSIILFAPITLLSRVLGHLSLIKGTCSSSISRMTRIGRQQWRGGLPHDQHDTKMVAITINAFNNSFIHDDHHHLYQRCYRFFCKFAGLWACNQLAPTHVKESESAFQIFGLKQMNLRKMKLEARIFQSTIS